MSKKSDNFKDYYIFPLEKYDFDLSYIWTQSNNMAFNYIKPHKYDKSAHQNLQKLVDIINGNIKGEYTNVTINPVDPNIIQINGINTILIRGWGMLIGGTNKLPVELAKKVQDDFRDYIINKLLGK